MITDITKPGLRGKIGLILPSANTITEPTFYAMAPQGISFHASRTFITGTSVADVLAMDKEKNRAVSEVASTNPNCISDCCTASGIVRGLEADRAFCAETENNTGITTTSTLQSINEVLKLLGVNRLVITSPYPEEMDKLEKSFFEKNGFGVINVRGLGLKSAIELAQVTPEEIYRLCMESWDSQANGLFISCMNFNPMPVIQALELALKVPVVTSNTATLWKVLRTVGVNDTIPGYGKLLAEHMSEN